MIVTPPPAIGPVGVDVARPQWSVMIPAYNAGAHLEETLRSVLSQDPGADAMQIAVVDDRSPDGEAERVVARLAPGRVEFHRNAENLRLAGNWNRCLELARGRWVHLLHQDDTVLPGFYERLGRADADESVGMAFTQYAIILEDGTWESISGPERRGAGIVDGWLGRISRGQRLQCPAIAVRRAVYETLGGYRPDLRFVLDWEMWVRIAASYPVWFEPTVLACFRVHGASETARLRRAAMDLKDIGPGVDIVAAQLPADLKADAGRELITAMASEGLREAHRQLTGGDYRSGLDLVRAACRLDPALRFSRIAFRYRKWALKLRLKNLVGRRPVPVGREVVP